MKTRTITLTEEELQALNQTLPASAQEMTPLRDAIDKIRAKLDELNARKNGRYSACAPDYGPREQQYRDICHRLTNYTVAGSSIETGMVEVFEAVNKQHVDDFAELISLAEDALQRGRREKLKR